MALAYGNHHELSHQLRFLLFEIGIGLPQNTIDAYITMAHRNALKKLQRAAISEGLLERAIASHHVHDFIDQLHSTLKNTILANQLYPWNKLREELDASIANHALALAYKHYWNTQLKKEANQHPSLWSWMNKEQSPYQSLLFLEQWGQTKDHDYPDFRITMGLTRREVLQNAPEFQAKINIHWCALRKEMLQTSDSAMRFNQLMAQSFPKEYNKWNERLIFNHIDPQNYLPIPVHPLIWRNQLQESYAHKIDDKSLILLPHHQAVLPSTLLHTVFPITESQCVLQLLNPMDLDNQKESATYDLTQRLHSILTQSNNYMGTLFVATKLAHISAADKFNTNNQSQKLSATLLQNPLTLLQKNQRALPLHSLFSQSPITQSSLLIEMIKASDISPVTYFAHYCYLVLFSQLHLLLRHKIVFESSQQHMLVIFTDNKPQALIMKNLERTSNDANSIFRNIKKKESPTVINEFARLRPLFMQNTLQNNIIYWIERISNECQITIPHLWDRVNQTFNTVLDELANEIEPHIFQCQKQLILRDVWQQQNEFTLRFRTKVNKNKSTNAIA